MGSALKPGCQKRVKGESPLRGQGAELPCGVWGNAPTVPRATSMPNALNKGAGSEASLPVTLRVRRRAPKLLFPQLAYCRAKWARPSSCSFLLQMAFPETQGFRLCGGESGAMKTGEVCGRPLETFGSPLPELTFVAAGGNHACGRESCHHCLVMGQPPHADGCKNHPNCDQKMKNPRKMVIMLARE